MKKVLAIVLILSILLVASIIISTPEVSARNYNDTHCDVLSDHPELCYTHTADAEHYSWSAEFA